MELLSLFSETAENAQDAVKSCERLESSVERQIQTSVLLRSSDQITDTSTGLWENPLHLKRNMTEESGRMRQTNYELFCCGQK
jgi:hypothetical protein